MDELIVDILFGEGGDDSKLFVDELASAYLKYGEGGGLKADILSSDFGHCVIKFRGPGAWAMFQGESGNHCVQRVPPTEGKGRRQTSYVSVAVLPLPPEGRFEVLPESELRVTYTVGSGPGGQHRNKTASTVRMVHEPTGAQVVIDGRDQHSNRREALRILSGRVALLRESQAKSAYNDLKRDTMGSKGRGEKVRTYNFIQSRVADHRTGKKTGNIKGVMRGDFSLVL